ncbi:hypothetical protein O6H91_13G075400 [Diphasiastrum complanatum]|uniref:Uncharacterized protein n=1 Tax=Diphasiastrum complanatum TaxID=34168 RepID=A0ACC2BWC9_DIPCM|nr:hypothetical protein O6H91_13G075400 [Diphasiastrum complanatum]
MRRGMMRAWRVERSSGLTIRRRSGLRGIRRRMRRWGRRHRGMTLLTCWWTLMRRQRRSQPFLHVGLGGDLEVLGGGGLSSLFVDRSGASQAAVGQASSQWVGSS